MRERVVKAVLLKSGDYQENDKILRLFTLEEGVVTAAIKGVKKPAAKLKFGCQPFAFCEYTLVTGKSGFNTVTNCKALEDFFSISSDYEKFTAGSLLLECADAAAGENKNEELFIMLLKAIKEILYGNFTPKEICCFFIERVLSLSGHAKIKEVFKDTSRRFISGVVMFEKAFDVRLKSAPLV